LMVCALSHSSLHFTLSRSTPLGINLYIWIHMQMSSARCARCSRRNSKRHTTAREVDNKKVQILRNLYLKCTIELVYGPSSYSNCV
jgi:hypothetical protein